MDDLTPAVLLDGLKFPEGPRWRDGRLWFSDMWAHRVMTTDPQGRTETVVAVPGRPSGLGWTPDGRLLIVSMADRVLYRLDPEGLRPVAELAGLTGGDINDMVTDAAGRSYIGNFGFDLGREEPRRTALILVTPDGAARPVADGLLFPNGAVITPDGRTLVAAETFANVLTAFDIAEDGSLSGKRVWAELGDATPDGICLDAEGAIWVSSFNTSVFLRVREGGAVTHRIAVPGKNAVACMLGGDDRRTLFLLTSQGTAEDRAAGRSQGWIETVRVDVPGAGLP